MEINRIELINGDITKIEVDAIINAANNSLLGGGGVDGAIHRAAGQKLYKECLLLNGCKTGEVKITKGFNLPSKFIIHTVGPVWRGGIFGEKDLLQSCYLKSLKLAVEYNLKTIAIPNISTGVYCFPKKTAAEIAIKTVSEFLNKDNSLEKVFFITFDKENFEIYNSILNVEKLVL
jgi:O-acetyl-ADP-ribose deacetylase (regulator of RNase III)